MTVGTLLSTVTVSTVAAISSLVPVCYLCVCVYVLLLLLPRGVLSAARIASPSSVYASHM